VTPDLDRVVTVLRDENAPLCERCVAHHARMTISRAAAALKSLRETVAVTVEHDECPGCQQYTQTFALAKTREDADVVSRTAPEALRENDVLVCPVCRKKIEPRHPVTIDHGVVVHADCWGRPTR